MRSGPALHYHLPARRAGSFGSSPIGRIAESVTLTWFRFEILLLWLALVAGFLAMSLNDWSSALRALLFSPVMALALWVLLKLTGWLFYFVPGVGRAWGWGRLMFIWLFSRAVVEPAPDIELPLWSTK